MVWAATNMDDNTNEVVKGICIRAVLHSVAQFELEREDYSVHELPHPAPSPLLQPRLLENPGQRPHAGL